MPNKKRDLVLYAAAVLLLCLGGVFALLWLRRNDRLACRPSLHSHHAPKMENYAKPEPDPNPSSILGHLSTEFEAGCHRLMPTGCDVPKGHYQYPKGQPFRDSAGDANADQCATNTANWNDYCTRNDAEWIYVGKRSKDMYRHPGPAPKTQGCWVANPTGCPKQSWNPDVNSYKWYDPTAGGSPQKCAMRQQTINDACGKTDALMVYNSWGPWGRPIDDILSDKRPKKISLVVYIVPGRMPALFTFVGGIRCMHPFPPLVCTEGVR